MHSGWTFLTNHGHVLLAVASTPDARVQDVAATNRDHRINGLDTGLDGCIHILALHCICDGVDAQLLGEQETPT